MLLALAPAPPAAAAGGPSELVPAYFAPEGSPSPWQQMCAASAGASIAILNPDNGPGRRATRTYTEAMSYCAARGWSVIGYVYTRYGKRALRQVEKSIAKYYSFYPGVAGIFLDEMASAPSAKLEGYYGALAWLVHEKGGTMVANPGATASSGWQLAYADTLVTFEGSAAQFESYLPAAWVLEAQRRQIADIVYGASSSAQMQQACTHAQEANAGFVYVTDLAGHPNPYASLPSYWPSELEDC